MRGFADDKFNVTEKLKLVEGRVENVEKRENAVNQHVLLLPQCFPQASFQGDLKL